MNQVTSFAESTDAVVTTLDKELEQLKRFVSINKIIAFSISAL